tara:strand:- start:171 stop:377 length:207 start_codon:yes stop_codon:yes gene_type:complete
MRLWINTQMEELMGESDATLATFVLKLLLAREGSAAATTKLKPLLDDDAEGFVRDLYVQVIEVSGKQQ